MRGAASNLDQLSTVERRGSGQAAPDSVPGGTPSSYPLSLISGADDLKAIEALTGFGSLHRTGTATWALRQALDTTDTPRFARLGVGRDASATAILALSSASLTNNVVFNPEVDITLAADSAVNLFVNQGLGRVRMAGFNYTGTMRAMSQDAFARGSGLASLLVAGEFSAGADAASEATNVTRISVVRSIIRNSGSGTITTADGMRLVRSGAGTITNCNGYLAEGMTAANMFGFRGLVAAGANQWNVYCDGTAQNFLSGGAIVGNTLATTAVDGFLYVPSCAGTPTGTPTAYGSALPVVVDRTNHKLYFYSGGAWRDAGP